MTRIQCILKQEFSLKGCCIEKLADPWVKCTTPSPQLKVLFTAAENKNDTYKLTFNYVFHTCSFAKAVFPVVHVQFSVVATAFANTSPRILLTHSFNVLPPRIDSLFFLKQQKERKVNQKPFNNYYTNRNIQVILFHPTLWHLLLISYQYFKRN